MLRAIRERNRVKCDPTDQIRKLEDRLEELEAALAVAQAEVEPAMKDLLARREQAKADLDSLERDRAAFAAGVDPREMRMYDSIRAGGRRTAVSELTHDGACGNCFGVVPLQLQNEVRHGASLIRCEACGVILAAPSPVAEEAEANVAAEPGAEAGE